MKNLLLDASTNTIYAGVFDGGAWLTFLSKSAGAMESLFQLSREIFTVHPLPTIDRIVLCEGPGRLMSLRIAAVTGNQWCTQNKERMSYNSLQLAAVFNGTPIAYELRAGSFAIWQNEKMEIVPQLPQGIPLIGSSVTPASKDAYLYPQALNALPLLADKILKPTPFFDPPLFTATSYVLATNKILSKDSQT